MEKNSIDLVVSMHDNDLVEISNDFINDLEKNFNEYNEKTEQLLKENEKYINKSNDYNFYPERLSKVSPLTILNAPWGTGKTFFIENLVKLFIDKKVKSNKFKKIIIMDAWKFSSSKNVSYEFLHELTKRIVENNENIAIEKKEKLWKIICKKLESRNWSFSGSVSILGVKLTGGLKTSANKKEEDEDLVIKSIYLNETPTLIFIDNIERLGSHSWDLLKVILKVQEFKNYLIVLPLNLLKMKGEKYLNDEYPIEKYIDFNGYNFLKLNLKNEEIALEISNILDQDIGGEKISIRQLEKLFSLNRISELENRFEILAKIREKIWNPKAYFNSLAEKEIDKFINYHEDRANVLREFRDAIESNDFNLKEKFFIEEDWETASEISFYDFEENTGYYYVYNHDYKEEFKKLNKLLLNKNKSLLNEIKKLKTDLSNELINRNSLENEIITEKNKLDRYLKSEQNFEVKKNTVGVKYDESKHSLNTMKIEKVKDRIEFLEESYKKMKEKIENINKDLQDLNKDVELLGDCFKKEIEDFKFIDKKWEKEIEDFDKIKLFLNKKMNTKEIFEREKFEIENKENMGDLFN